MNPCNWELSWQGRQLLFMALGALVASLAVPLDECGDDSAVQFQQALADPPTASLLQQGSGKLGQTSASADAVAPASLLGTGSAHGSARTHHTVTSHVSARAHHAVTGSANVSAPGYDCLETTGNACSASEGCAPVRGVCQVGFCAGVEDACYQEKGKQIGTGIKLKNARYPDKFLLDEHFDIYTFPGQGDQPQYFVLGSVERPGIAATVAEAGAKWYHKIAKKKKGIAVQSVKTEGTVAARLAVKLIAAPEYDGAPTNTQSVMIESFDHHGNYIYLDSFPGRLLHGSPAVFKGDPGAAGYWIPEPPLTLRLSTYHGARCSSNCGSYGSGTNYWAVAGVIALVVLGVVGAILAIINTFSEIVDCD